MAIILLRRTFSLPHHHIMLPYWDWITFGMGDCKIAVIVSLLIRLISCWDTPQNAGVDARPLYRQLAPSVLNWIVSES
jgi:hypothetical protein